MTTVTIPLAGATNRQITLEPEKHSADKELKYKVRDINLMMYNPNLFLNRDGGFFEIIGGYKTLSSIFGFGFAGVLYRERSNANLGIRKTYGGWGKNITFFAGASMGLVFSALFFAQTQQLFNDYTALFLLKRYPGAKTIDRKDIWLQRHKLNDDEHYYFTSSYMNTYHM